MAEALPEIFQEGTPERHHVARLSFVPNQILFEGLKRFYQNPYTVRRIGKGAMALHSLKSMSVGSYTFRPFGGAGETFDMSDVDRIDNDLRHLNHNDSRLVMSDHLAFSRLKGNGIAIELAVELSPLLTERLHGTGLLADDTSSVHVDLRLYDEQHAGGVAMKDAAANLKSILEREAHLRTGTDTVNLVIKH